MAPNNNFSVLPWYSSIEEQNARKWWAYGRVYPLFTPAGYLLPFQLLREQRGTSSPGEEIELDSTVNDKCIETETGELIAQADSILHKFVVEGIDRVYFDNLGIGDLQYGDLAAAYDENDAYLDSFAPQEGENVWTLPTGTSYIYIVYEQDALQISDKAYEVVDIPTPISSFIVYDANTNAAVTGNIVGDLVGLAIKNIPLFGKDAIVFGGHFPFSYSFPVGRYYCAMSDGVETWYSEVFTSTDEVTNRLKIEWWDDEDFYMDAGVIVYKNPDFVNVLYLCTDVAKPEYIFEEEGEERDGYFFPEKQISEKRYHFQFFAPEYLLDVMRFIRMADHIKVTKGNDEYSVDTFLITPEWIGDGDVASAEVQFDTATVAKKIGKGYIRARRGDFNDDFNNDFD